MLPAACAAWGSNRQAHASGWNARGVERRGVLVRCAEASCPALLGITPGAPGRTCDLAHRQSMKRPMLKSLSPRILKVEATHLHLPCPYSLCALLPAFVSERNDHHQEASEMAGGAAFRARRNGFSITAQLLPVGGRSLHNSRTCDALHSKSGHFFATAALW